MTGMVTLPVLAPSDCGVKTIFIGQEPPGFTLNPLHTYALSTKSAFAGEPATQTFVPVTVPTVKGRFPVLLSVKSANAVPLVPHRLIRQYRRLRSQAGTFYSRNSISRQLGHITITATIFEGHTAGPIAGDRGANAIETVQLNPD